MLTRLQICVVTAFVLAGCSGLTQMQDAVTKFDLGAHAVATGQMAYFQEVQTADCSYQFYQSADLFARNVPGTSLALNGNCTPIVLDDKQIKGRQALMDSITLYADKIQALATDDNNKTLDTNSQNLAGQINTLAKAHGLPSSALSLSGDVEAAVVGIAEMVLDQRRYSDIRGAAQNMGPYLSKVIELLKSENLASSAVLDSKIDGVEIILRLALAEAQKKEGPRSFFDVITARNILRSVNPLGAPPLTTTNATADPALDPQNVAKQLNAALDAVVNSNNALAQTGTGGVVAAVNDLIARAQHVNSIISTINK